MSQTAAVPSRSRIGNDVMDLRDPRCRERDSDDPLLTRILSLQEREWLEGGTDAELWSIRLWALWAAKEAAFKVHCKLAAGEGGPFLPKSFSCRLETDVPSDGTAVRIHGKVDRVGGRVPVRVEGSSNRSYVHLVGWDGTNERPRRGRLELGLEAVEPEGSEEDLEALRPLFTAAEWEGIYSLRSARARLLARDRIRAHVGSTIASARDGFPDTAVEIRTARGRPRQSPPRIWFAGREVPELDLSLSHHGRFVAWALLVPEPV